MGRMDYCNSLLLRVPDIHLNKLQRVQNTMARLVCIVPRFCHIAPVLRSLHWLPVKLELISKFLVITFKAINGLAPNDISGLIKIIQPSNYSLQSNYEILLQPLTTGAKKTLGDRAFASAAPKLWNGLPSSIRNANVT